jgi:hypothetical protein
MKHTARGVYHRELPADSIQSQDIEYYIEATNKKEETLRYPASAPKLCQTVIMTPEAK